MLHRALQCHPMSGLLDAALLPFLDFLQQKRPNNNTTNSVKNYASKLENAARLNEIEMTELMHTFAPAT